MKVSRSSSKIRGGARGRGKSSMRPIRGASATARFPYHHRRVLPHSQGETGNQMADLTPPTQLRDDSFKKTTFETETQGTTQWPHEESFRIDEAARSKLTSTSALPTPAASGIHSAQHSTSTRWDEDMLTRRRHCDGLSIAGWTAIKRNPTCSAARLRHTRGWTTLAAQPSVVVF